MSNRSRFLLLAVVIIVAVAGALVFEPWVLWQTDVVDEAFPIDDMTEEQQAAYTALPDDMKTELMAMAQDEAVDPAMVRETTTAVLGPDVPVAEEPMEDMTTETMVLGMGEFGRIDAIHAASGTAAIYALPDGQRVLRLEDFTSTNGPDLHVLLTTGTEAKTFGELGEYWDLGQLKGNVGNQNYPIPDDIDLALVKSVVIYCKPFRVVFSVADLT